MVSKLLSASRHYSGLAALLLWGGLTLLILRQDALALDEGAARALLLLWSIADQVASSAVHFGTPDLRLLLYVPTGFLWTGSIFAAKVLTVLLVALAVRTLFFWRQQKTDAESALIPSGLLLISPLTLAQIDTLSPGIYLLLAFATGAWLDQAYRTTPRPFGGWYFAQLFLSAFSISLHPAGLAYPLALLWGWHKDPINPEQQKFFYIGIGLTMLLTLIISLGWHDVEWLRNPAPSLASIFWPTLPDQHVPAWAWAISILFILALVVTLTKQHRQLLSDTGGRSLALGLLFGTAACDSAWALIALTILLYFGFPLLLRAQALPTGGLLHQRGTALAAIFICSTLFMNADKAHLEMHRQGMLSGQDQLIQALSREVELARKAAENADEPPTRFRVASQWPSRTMIACKCDTLPLPPAAQDAQEQLIMLRGITHLVFDPNLPGNAPLSQNLAKLGGGTAETVELLPEGALLRLRSATTAQ